MARGRPRRRGCATGGCAGEACTAPCSDMRPPPARWSGASAVSSQLWHGNHREGPVPGALAGPMRLGHPGHPGCAEGTAATRTARALPGQGPAPPPQRLMQPWPRCQQLLPAIRLELAPSRPTLRPTHSRGRLSRDPRRLRCHPPVPTAWGQPRALRSCRAPWPNLSSPCSRRPNCPRQLRASSPLP